MIKQFREKTVAELDQLIRGWKSELLALRFQQAVGQLEKPHKFRELRVSVARAMTVLAEKKAAGMTEAEAPKKRTILPKRKKASSIKKEAAPVEHKAEEHKFAEPKARKTKPIEAEPAHEEKMIETAPKTRKTKTVAPETNDNGKKGDEQ